MRKNMNKILKMSLPNLTQLSLYMTLVRLTTLTLFPLIAFQKSLLYFVTLNSQILRIITHDYDLPHLNSQNYEH